MAKTPKKGGPSEVEETTTGEGTAQSEAEDPNVAEAREAHKVAVEDVVSLREALVEAEQVEAQRKSELDALTEPPPPPPVTGPRIHLEEHDSVIPSPDGEYKTRSHTIGGHNYEHVGEVDHDGEKIWSYRRMK